MIHAKYSPSKLPRIIKCPGSVEMSEHITQDSSGYADEGTMLHQVVQECIDIGEFTLSPETCIKYQLREEDGHQDAIQECLDYIVTLGMTYNDPDAYYQTESKVSLAPFVQVTKCDALADVYGILDFTYVFPNQRLLYVIDWKFGKGIEVFPDSDQIKAYAAGKLGSFKKKGLFDTIFLVIAQPRLYSEDRIKILETNPGELTSWLLRDLIPALINVASKHPKLNPSEEACRWCAAKQVCPARKEQADQAASEVFRLHADLPHVDVKEIVRLLKVIPDLKAYMSDIELWAFNQLRDGKEVPGYKLVEGRSIRQWEKEEEAKKVMAKFLDENNLYTKKFISPAQAEKKVGLRVKKSPEFTGLIVKPKGKPTLVPMGDKRPPLDFETAEEKFAQYVEGPED